MKNYIKRLKKAFPNFALATFSWEIEKNLNGCKSLLDVGCGDNSPIRLLINSYNATGLDGHKPSINLSKKNGLHSEYIQGDINKLDKLVKEKSFDAVIALDVIEHLKKEDGFKLLENMEGIANKKVILVTPNGFVPQYSSKNKLQQHLSGWNIADFEKKGYKVQGIYGTRFCNIFRNEDASLRFKPKLFWGLVWATLAELSHYLFTKNHPKYSIGLLAVKKLH